MIAGNPVSPTRRLTARPKAGRWIERFFAGVGLITVLVILTPVDAWWAHAYSGPMEQPKGEVLILLSAANDDKGLISFSSYWRARYALLAWQSGGFQKIVISGGGGPGIVDFLIAEGIPREKIIAEWQSTTTRENAVNTGLLVQGMPGRKVLLTSDFHMYRAARAFRKLGIDVTPEPIPDVSKSAEHWNARFAGFETMLLESAKIADYKMHGWI
jgi:uncharacterized SAM-binding protein YcdF (DUF218 family)